MKCANCGVEFETGNQKDNHIYCTTKCREKANNDKRKKIRTCLQCGKETSKKYCSLECGTKYRNSQRKLKSLIQNHKNNGFSDKDKQELVDVVVGEA